MNKTVHKVRRDVRREQIVQAALRIVAEKGVNALTTATIAHEVGVSEANLYRHFTNKDEIISEMIESIGVGLRSNMESVIRLKASPLKRLERLFTLHLTYMEKNEGIPRLVFSEGIHAGREGLKERLLGLINEYASVLKALIKKGQSEGVIRKDIDREAAALMFIGLIQVLAMKWSLSSFAFSLMDEGKKAWRGYERYLSR